MVEKFEDMMRDLKRELRVAIANLIISIVVSVVLIWVIYRVWHRWEICVVVFLAMGLLWDIRDDLRKLKKQENF